MNAATDSDSGLATSTFVKRHNEAGAAISESMQMTKQPAYFKISVHKSGFNQFGRGSEVLLALEPPVVEKVLPF